jgi:hypothetical protein
MNEQCFHGIARAGLLQFRIGDYFHRIVNVRTELNINVAVALSGLDYRDTRIFNHTADQLLPPTGKYNINETACFQYHINLVPVAGFRQGDSVRDTSAFGKPCLDSANQRDIGLERGGRTAQ